MNRPVIAATLLALTALCAAPLLSQSAAPPRAVPRVAQFGWMAGEWQGTLDNGMKTEMECSTPLRGTVVCWFRLTSATETVMYELISYLDTPTGVEMRFRHFSPALQAWSTGPATTMLLESASPDTLHFENHVDGQPKRSIITRMGDDGLLSHSDLIASDGATSVIEVRYTRVR